MNILSKCTIGLLSLALLAGCDDDSNEDVSTPPAPTIAFTKVSGSGDIKAKVDEFRALLSIPTNSTQTVGGLQIGWDGVPAAQTNVDTFPGDFFNSTDPNVGAGRKRGLVYNTSTGTRFRVSDNDFKDLNTSYADQFNAFSPARTFSPIGTTVSENLFRVPGQTTPATTRGFGAVFSDVDKAGSTTMEFFEGSKSLGKFEVPVRSDANGFSFLGVFFPDNKVSRVVITSGNAPVGGNFADGGQYDLVVMDDFFFDEPKAD